MHGSARIRQTPMTSWSLRLNCHNICARFPNTKENAGAGASTSGRAKRARPPADEGNGDDEDGSFEGTEDTDIAEIARGIDALIPKTKTKTKTKANASKPKAETSTAATPTSTPARVRRRPQSRVRVQVPPRSEQESDVGSSGKVPAAATATPASRSSCQRRHLDAKSW